MALTTLGALGGTRLEVYNANVGSTSSVSGGTYFNFVDRNQITEIGCTPYGAGSGTGVTIAAWLFTANGSAAATSTALTLINAGQTGAVSSSILFASTNVVVGQVCSVLPAGANAFTIANQGDVLYVQVTGGINSAAPGAAGATVYVVGKRA